jgi:chromosome segregation ATPase
VKQLHFILSAISLASLLLAANTANAERTFKWVDAQGNTHYGDRVPIQSAAQQRREINEQGRTLKAYAEPGSQEAHAEQKRQAALEYERQQQSEEQSRQDSELLATYASETDILIARDSELGAIEEFIRMTNIRIDSLQKRLDEMAGEAASYEKRGKPVPEFVQHQTARIQQQIDQNKTIISNKQAEMDSINKRYAADIAHYQRLQNHRLSAR